MGKRRSPMLQKVSNIIKISIFIAKMRFVYLKKATKLSKFRVLKHHNSYGFLQERQFSPSRQDHHRVMVDENYSMESAIVELERDSLQLLHGEEEEEEEDSVDKRAERFIERFYEEMKRQRRESSSSSANLPLNRMLEF